MITNLFRKSNNDDESNSFLPKEDKNSYKIQPSIDSYIINTIKLNQILKNRISFDQIEFFSNMNLKNENKNKKTILVKTDQDARDSLKKFICIMCIHSGFNGIRFAHFIIMLKLIQINFIF